MPADKKEKKRRRIKKVINRFSGGINNKVGYIYIVKCHDYYKVGCASDLKGRIGNLQCGNPYMLEVVFYLQMPYYDVIEKTLHETLLNYNYPRIRGEWYLLGAKELDDVVGTIKGSCEIAKRHTYGND
ncbi:MAG: GIY-YIG nuclease family protein [Bacteroidota bacterium]|nr:GIY-YIG nuclease family protein [Bacteroidota bacterium]